MPEVEELKAKNEALNAEIETLKADAIELVAKHNEEVEALKAEIETLKNTETPAKPEAPVASEFAGKSFTFNKKKYGFNMPATSVKQGENYVPYTYEEVMEDKDLQELFAELCDAGETFFIKPLK
jgi:hypothetical protein